MVKKKRIIVTLLLLLIFTAIIAFAIYPYIGEYKVDKNLKAILFNNNGSDGAIQLRIDGILNNNIFEASVFTGEFQVEGYDFSFDNEYTVLLYLDKSERSDLLSGTLAYVKFPGMDQKSIGKLFTDRRMDTLIIQLFNRTTFTYIVYADNIDDAKAIIHKHLS